ncbi:uncharacterized protein LY89DRAFT_712924 [Mollisia scopiformis]|uniref:Uncharacterized protein n=1 Tax=Mollisia scopiformis TaxID=149040 RepID=A0A194XW74_MOLSC|nr:uncharacterized protein LY89DRAFT_712924 [Mollisia scopiformis]KUJ23972.1 hypothetical protein LY89DRAFT_712924 [Mollisia scopiformis]
MPQESKRQGVSSSEIVLGFPIGKDGQPRRESQQAYAFLPIRDYGFEFLIQADFLLIASREDIDDSSEWNHALRAALFPALLDTVKEFNKGKFRYSWPRYLPIREPLQSFLKPFHLEMRNKLALQDVLYSQSGTLTRPNSLIYVPEKFTFNAAPLTISAQTSGRYLSGRYLESDLKYLEVMSVEAMSELRFFAELTSFLKTSMGVFKTKSRAWHSHLASILMRLPREYYTQLADLTLVPLNNGTWIAANGRQILFPAAKAEFELPGGLELSVVDSTAAADPARKKLYSFLGVGDLEQEPVVRHIRDLHQNNRVNSSSVSRGALVSQIKFLYSAAWINPEFQRFWFMSESGQRIHGSQLYQDSTKALSATFFFGAHRNKFRFIHKDYMEASGQGRKCDLWVAWLEEKMDVATIPRLVSTTTDRGFKLSEDFEFIIKTFPSFAVLGLLRENWDKYSRFFDPDELKKWNEKEIGVKYDTKRFHISGDRLKQKLSSMLVTCTDGKKHRLDTTFLPSKELLVLSILGVSIKVDVSVYLRCLEQLALESSNDSARIMKLLDTIQYRCGDEKEAAIIKKFFTDRNNLIYIPAARKGANSTWLPKSQCRWKGPPLGKVAKEPRTFKSLKDIYPGKNTLFCDILGIQDATLRDLLEEAKSFAVGDSLAHITSIFHAMEKLLEEDEHPISTTAELRNFDFNHREKMFPVSKVWNLDTDEASEFQDSSVVSEWFIADTAPLRTIFAGVVPLLDVKVDDLAPMDQVLTELGLKSRLLSKQVVSVPKTHGTVVLNEELTSLSDRRLIPTTKNHRARRQEIVKELRNLQVYTADEVIQEWCVTYKKKAVKGPPGNGRVALVAENDVLKIYLAVKGGFEMEQTPIELVDEMFTFCGMQAQNPPHSEMCLHIALSQGNLAGISKVFADKGIPSLEGLKFADRRTSEDGTKDEMEEGQGADGSKNKFRVLRELPLIVLGLPVGIVVGVGAGVGSLIKSRKLFDGKVDGDDDKIDKSNPKPKKKVKPAKPQRPAKAPKQGDSGFDNFQNSLSRGLARLQLATLCSETVAFRGELYVHKILASALGQNYNPLIHWTFPRRSRAHIPRFHTSNSFSHATFTFTDPSGAFTQLLHTHHYPGAANWAADPPTYHIDVKAAKGDVKSEFVLSPVEFERAKRFSVLMREEGKGPRDVYILARVFDVGVQEEGEGEESRMVFLVDPWEFWHAGRMGVRVEGRVLGTIV